MQDINDIYIKGKNDPDYIENKITTNSKFENIISKIYMILFTNQGDVLGDYDFGANIPKFLQKTSFSVTTIKQNIQDQFEKYIPDLSKNEYTLNVYIFKGNQQDIGVVQVDLGIKSINYLFR